jgi:hypothetical protein
MKTAGPDTFGLRHYGGVTEASGRFLTPTLPATRSELALPPGNTMEHLAQLQIAEGTRYLSGEVGPNFNQPGGGHQVYLPNNDVLIRQH